MDQKHVRIKLIIVIAFFMFENRSRAKFNPVTRLVVGVMR